MLEVLDDDDKKPNKLVGLMPFDLRSELKSKLGTKSGFNLKKSATNVDIFSNNNRTSIENKTADATKTNITNTSDLLKSLREKQGKISLEENGQENLSFREKLKLIEKSCQATPATL